MGRRRRVDVKTLKAKLAKQPKVSPASKRRIEKIEDDPAMRAALCVEVAQVEETITQLREELLRGKAFAASAIVRAQKLRAELLRLKTPDVKAPPQGEGVIDVPAWVPLTPRLAGEAPPPTTDDADINDTLGVKTDA